MSSDVVSVLFMYIFVLPFFCAGVGNWNGHLAHDSVSCRTDCNVIASQLQRKALVAVPGWWRKRGAE